jgi:hypothetical protein
VRAFSVRFVPYQDLGDEPNIVVDGSGTASTVLTLSHWPGSRVAPALAADLSAEIVVRYLEQPDLHVDVDAVSNNHFDQDGLMGVWALVEPGQALAHRDLLIDVARAGDFTWSRTRDAARIAFTVGSLLDARQTSGDPYEEFLPRVPELLDDIGAFHAVWADEDAFLDDSDALIEHGDVAIDERPELDLAIVTIPSLPKRPYHRFTQPREGSLHPMAVFNRTPMTRIAYVRDRRYEVELRYESVVQFVSRPITPRPDLAVFADRLNKIEASDGTWYFEGVGGLTPSMQMRGADASSLTPTAFIDELLEYLPTAEPAWDPWTENGFR